MPIQIDYCLSAEERICDAKYLTKVFAKRIQQLLSQEFRFIEVSYDAVHPTSESGPPYRCRTIVTIVSKTHRRADEEMIAHAIEVILNGTWSSHDADNSRICEKPETKPSAVTFIAIRIIEDSEAGFRNKRVVPKEHDNAWDCPPETLLGRIGLLFLSVGTLAIAIAAGAGVVMAFEWTIPTFAVNLEFAWRAFVCLYAVLFLRAIYSPLLPFAFKCLKGALATNDKELRKKPEKQRHSPFALRVVIFTVCLAATLEVISFGFWGRHVWESGLTWIPQVDKPNPCQL